MTVVIDGREYIPIAEVAQRLETTETRILMLLKQKVLSGELVEGSWFVTADSVACFDAHGGQPEQQAHCRTSCSSSGCGCRG